MHYLKQELYEQVRQDLAIFDFIQENALDGLWFWDLENPEHKWMNPRFWRALGYNPDEMPHLTSVWQHIIHPDDLEKAKILIGRHLEDPSQPYEQEVRYRHKQGHTVWIRCKGTAIRDATGKPIRFLGTHIDITQAKQDAIKAQQEAQFLKSVYDNQSVFIVELDRHGNYTFVNNYYRDFFQWDDNNLIGTSSQIGIVPEDIPKLHEVADKCFSQPGVKVKVELSKEINNIRSTALWEFICLPNPADSNDLRILCIGYDISEQKLTEEHLQRVSLLLNDAQRIAKMGAWELDLATGRTFWTDEVYAIHEVTKDFDHNKDTAISFYHPDDQPVISRAIQDALDKQLPFDVTCRFITAKGNHRWVRASGYPVVKEGRVTRLTGMFQDITQSEEDKATIRREQQFSQKLLEKMGDGFLVISSTGQTLIVNAALCQMTGFSSEELVGSYPPYPYWPADETATIEAVFKPSVEAQGGNFELIFCRKNGEKFPVIVSVGSIKDPSGEVTNYFASIKDISERKKVEEELRQSRDQFQSLVDNIPGITYRCKADEQWTMIYMSRQIDVLSGYPAEDFIGNAVRSYASVQHPDDQPMIRQRTLAAIAANRPFELEYRVLHRDGSIRWAYEKGIAIRNATGEIDYLDGFILDITARKLAEQELIRTKNLLDQTSKVAQVGGWEYLLDTKKVIWTDIVRKIHEVPDDYVPDYNSAAGFYTPESIELLRQAIDRCQQFGTPYDLELHIITAKGRKKWVRVIGNAEMEDGRCVRMYGTFQDIDQRKKMTLQLEESRQRAEEANRAKSQFLANMSHEIRTPLNSVIGFSELLMRTCMSETQQQYIKAIHQSGNTLLNLVNDILDLSKIEAGKMELVSEKTDLYKLSSHVTEILRFKTNEKHLELLLRIAPQTPRYVWIDVVRIKQVLINLLGNAIKFTHQGEIELLIRPVGHVQENSQWLEFSVRDTGIGIPPERQKQIFEAFAQADASTTRQYGGTGLGLTISNQLLALMGSKLHLESKVNEGSRFYFRLKLPVESEQWTPPANLPFKKALIVDDNASSSLILQEMLAEGGIKADIAEDGMYALKRLSKPHPYDFVLIDYEQPFMDGMEIVRQIREKLPMERRKIPVVLMYNNDPDDRVRALCISYQICAKCAKPMTKQQLFDTLMAIGKRVDHKIEDKVAAVEEFALASDTQKTILITDDNELNRLLVENITRLLLPQATVLQAKDGLEAVAIAQTQHPDLILMDVQMPMMSGYDATKQIKTITPLQHIPIIALTAGTTPEEQEKCRQAGMDDYLSKPLDINRLRAIFMRWLPDQPKGSTEATSQAPAHTHMSFNREKLLENLGGSLSVLHKLIQIATNGAIQKSINQLVEAFSTQKPATEIQKLAHHLKGSASTLCLERLAQLADEVMHIDDYHSQQANTLMQQIMQEAAILQQLLQQELNNF
ncbi:PAS domain-containing protein [Rhodoflexus sp.]